MKEHRVQLDGFHLDVREVGSGSTTLLLVHSLTFDHRMWNRVTDALAPGFRLLLVDAHGHGTSGAPDRIYSLEDVADDVAAVLNALSVERVTWVGHSMGGMIGLRFALRHPERLGGLVLCNTTAQAESETTRQVFHHVNETSRGKTPNAETVNFILGLMFSPEFKAEHEDEVAPFEDMLFNAPDPEGAYRTGHAVIWRTSVQEELHHIQLPTLVVTSRADTATPPGVGAAIAEGIPGAKHVVLDGGHLSPVEQTGAFLAALKGFL